MKRMEGTLGFGIKVVERTGPSLRSQFPLSNLWEGTGCDRQDCTTCRQGAEVLPNCTKSSILYENICHACNPAARSKEPVGEVRSDVPTLYVGESSRSIYERSKEHWSDWRNKRSSSHIAKHQDQVHGPDEEPQFTMRVVKSYRTALARQIGEAVRIRRRGGEGSILNSKAEYSRCRIPRLVMEQQDDEEIDKLEEEELNRRKEQLEEELQAWSNIKYYAREQQMRETKNKIRRIEKRILSKKREQADAGEGKAPKRRRKLEHPIMGEDWGKQEPPEPAGHPLTSRNRKNETLDSHCISVSHGPNISRGLWAPPTQVIPNTDSLSGVILGEGCPGGGCWGGGHPRTQVKMGNKI